ncbi:hypothetical protein C8R46DRAFT_1031158 [Mycena filopes]|nr:hypothetical protein C8R46DRAFT_1031158 [Mycena filopes]
MAEEQYYTRALFQGLRIIWESTHRYLESIGLGSPAAVIRLAAAMGQVTTASLVARLPGVNEAVAESTSRWLERRQSSLQALFEIPSSSVASARPALALDTPITAHVGYVPGPPGVFIPLWWAAAIAVVLCFVGVVVLAHLVEAGVFRGWRRRPVASAAQRAADVEERIQRQPERVAGDPRPDLDALVPTLLEFLCVLAEAIRVEPPASLAAARASNRNGHPVDPLAAPEREHVEAAPDPHPVPKTAYLDAVVEGAETLLTRFPLEIRSTPTSTTPSHFAPMRVLAAQQALIDSPALPRARVAKAPITPAAPLSSAPTDGRSLVASPLEDWVGPDDWLDTDPFASPTPRASTSTAVPFVPRRFSSAADGETDYKRRDVGEEQEEADEQVEVLQNPADRKGKGRAEWR